MTFASKCQHLIYWGPLKKPVEWTLKTILAPWSYIASVVYHDMYWYTKNYGRVEEILNSDWGRLFANWEQLQLPADDLSVPGWEHVGDKPLKLDKETSKMIRKAFRVLGTAIREAPELAQRNQKKHANKNVLSNGTLFHYLRQKPVRINLTEVEKMKRTACAVLCIFVLTFLFSGCSREKRFLTN